MPELLEKDAKKCHIELGRHLEFLRKKYFIKIRYSDNQISKKKFLKKRRFVDFKSKSNFGGHLELSSHF
jgi:hypothetical protein